jgi:hypothetical protein
MVDSSVDQFRDATSRMRDKKKAPTEVGAKI